MIVVFE